MVAPAAILGRTILQTVKNRLSKSAAKVMAGGGKPTYALNQIAKGNIKDVDAMLLNRLKTKPTAALKNAIMRELGLTAPDIKALMTNFKQTERIKKLGLGEVFKRFAVKEFKKTLGITRLDSLSKIINKMVTEGLTPGEEDKPYNVYVKSLLAQIQKELEEKLEGVMESGAGSMGRPGIANIDVDVMKYYNSSQDYTKENITTLEGVISKLTADFERYIPGTHQDVYLIKKGEVYSPYNQSAVLAYILDIKSDIKTALSLKVEQ